MGIDQLFKIIVDCRNCGKDELHHVLDLGNQPPANSLRNSSQESLPSIPLQLLRCDHCSTVQISATVKPEYLFSEYVWVTGTSKGAKKFSEVFCKELVKRCNKKELFIIEAASNDGTFLYPFREFGHRILGIEPARNIAEIAVREGIETLIEFFGEEQSLKIVADYGEADAVFARNVVPHVENVHDFIKGMAKCLKPEGVGAIEFHYAQKILDQFQYDSIYHEHLCYYSLESISILLNQFGLHVFDVIPSPISGGALVVYFSKTDFPKTEVLFSLIKREEDLGLNTREKWDAYGDGCAAHRDTFVKLVQAEVAKGSKLIGYGASARSSTLLNFCNIGPDSLECIADQNPIKKYKYTPGTNIKIVPPDEALALNPDVIVLLAWNFRFEIMELIKGKYQFRGKVILPLPDRPQVIEF
jgi:hypothetical protein